MIKIFTVLVYNKRLMIRRIGQSKFLAVFISAFLCLNLSGSFCLAYCQVKSAETKEEHCPLAKLDAENCPMSKSTGKAASHSNAVKRNALDCCSPSINAFIAPLEKHQISFQTNAVIEKTISFTQPTAFGKTNYQSAFSYQKPLYDYRKAHLKNCVFRI